MLPSLIGCGIVLGLFSGADVNAENNQAQTAWQLAIEHYDVDVINTFSTFMLKGSSVDVYVRVDILSASFHRPAELAL